MPFVLFYGYCGPEHRHTDTFFCDARSAFCIVLWVLWRLRRWDFAWKACANTPLLPLPHRSALGGARSPSATAATRAVALHLPPAARSRTPPTSCARRSHRTKSRGASRGSATKRKRHPQGCLLRLCCTALIDATMGKSIKSRGVQLLKRFYVHPKWMPFFGTIILFKEIFLQFKKYYCDNSRSKRNEMIYFQFFFKQ